MGTSKPDAGTYAPSGPPTCAARTGRPDRVPPPYSSTSSRRRHPEGQLDDAALLDVAGELEDLGAAGAAGAELGVRRAAVSEDHRHRTQRQHVVDRGGPAPQAPDGRDRRPGPHLAAAALEALEHRGLLAADVGACPDADVQVEGEAGAEDVLAEVAVGVRRVDRAPQGGYGVGVLGADVDVALVRPDGMGGDGHALDEGERVALDDHPVRERPGVALVEVAGHELQVGRRLQDGAPLDAGREAGAAASPQAGVGDFLDHLGRGERQRPAQPGPAAVRLVVGDRGRVDQPDPGEAHPALRGQPGVLVDHPDAGRLAREHGGDVVGGHVGIPHPARGGVELDQRLEPEHAAGPVADDLHPGCLEGGRHLVGADRDRGGVPGDEHPPSRRPQRHPSVSASSRSADNRPWRRPSSVPDGPSAQLPRQKTCGDLDVVAEAARPGSRAVVQRLGTRPPGTPRRGTGRRCAQPGVRCGSRGRS